MNRIKRFTQSKIPLNEKKRRLHEFKRLILSMPYTDTYYHFSKNPSTFFQESEYDIAKAEGGRRVR